MKTITLLFFSFFVATALAISIKDANRLYLQGCSLADCIILDSTEFVVRYNLDYLQDTPDGKTKHFDVLVFEVGSRFTKFYGLKSYLLDLCLTKREKGEIWTEADKERFRVAGDGIVDYEIIRDMNRETLLSIHHIPFKENQVIQYQENSPVLEWKISEKRKTILGYVCWQATMIYGGRQWLAWYTPEIACNAGLWKTSGLPGLILELYDSRSQFVFTAIEITQTRKPIEYYKRPTLEWTKQKWQEFDKKAHLSPLLTFSQNGQIKFYQADYTTKKLVLLDESWAIPYNPLELE